MATTYDGGKTSYPTGLTITRRGMSFTCTWKCGAKDYNGGQEFQWRTNISKWQSVAIGRTTTVRTVSVAASDFYPTTKRGFAYISFRVRGKRGNWTDTKTGKTYAYKWSDWNTRQFNIDRPYVPTTRAELDEERDNRCTFFWDTTVNADDHRPFVNNEYQSVLIRACKVTDGSKVGWSTANRGWRTGVIVRASSLVITEETETLTLDSYTRWFRVRSRGPRGSGEWRYTRHVYAKPYKPTIDAKSITSSVAGGTTTVKFTWTAPWTVDHPIDKTIVQWVIDTPLSGRVCPAGASWNDAATLNDTGGIDQLQFQIDNTVGVDQCLWVRVIAVHDRTETISNPAIVRSGALAAPTLTSVETDSSTYRATVTAENNSSVPDSRIAIVFRTAGIPEYVCGIIAHGSTSAIVGCPQWSSSESVQFGVYAFQGTYTSAQRADGKTEYSVTANMKSSTVWGTGTVPMPPDGVTASQTDTRGEVLLTWYWTWGGSTAAEVSWSQNPNAWESTEEPNTYRINRTFSSRVRVSGLETGVTWYFRVRLIRTTADSEVFGDYSDAVSVNLSSPPSTPILALSTGVVTQTQSFVASWDFDASDGTTQSYAEVCEADITGDEITYGSVIAKATTEQSITIPASLWETGTTHYLAVRVTSTANLRSEWSDPVPIAVADPISCEITSTSLEEITIVDEDENERTVLALTEFPLTITVTGAGVAGTTTVAIERAESYRLDRPDESIFKGYEGEAVVTYSQLGEDAISISQADLVGNMDDGAQYRIVATTEDSLGQTATATLEYEVHWGHQALVPSATVEISDTIAKITPIAPNGALTGDVCDIYRLSADKPELILQGVAWGVQYVDPYPAIGELGGHRVVFRTYDGDYITADGRLAWTDLGSSDDDILESEYIIINFADAQIFLEYDLDVSSAWAKDFKETQYLGGAIQGDWNPAVSRTGTVSTLAIETANADTIRDLRKLAAYAGICHMRIPDGSSFPCDIQVSESRDHDSSGHIAKFSLSYTRVDAENLDGVTYAEWIEGGGE